MKKGSIIFSILLITFFAAFLLKKNEKVYPNDVLKVAILDSGIKTDSEVFKYNVVKTYNTFDETIHNEDTLGHGTAIASIITDSISENIELYDVKVLNDEGVGSVDNLIRGMEWAIEESVDVMNISLGIHQDNPDLKKVVDKALANDITIVASAGNNYGIFIDYPAKYPGVISVSSVRENYEKVFRSEKGKIDLVDYGLNVKSLNTNGETDYFSGTSFATASVSSKISKLILEGKLEKSNKRLLENLNKYTIDLGPQGKDTEFGYGFLKEP